MKGQGNSRLYRVSNPHTSRKLQTEMKGTAGSGKRRAGELSALSGKWLLCINWAACISWSNLLNITFGNRRISLVLHWAASLVGFGFLTLAMGALFLSIFCDGLGPGYSYYAPPLPLYLAIRLASDAIPLSVPCDAVRAVLRARTGERGLRPDGTSPLLHRRTQKAALVESETCRQFLRVKHSTPLRQTPL